jgi:hypothetical protein
VQARRAVAGSRFAIAATEWATAASDRTRDLFSLDANDVRSRNVPALIDANRAAAAPHRFAVDGHDGGATEMSRLGETLTRMARYHTDEGSPESVEHGTRLRRAARYARRAASHHSAARRSHETSSEAHGGAASGYWGSTPLAVDEASRASHAAARIGECLNGVCDALRPSGIIEGP